ncbi:MAG: transcription antitermination factor NusB [Candidatus Campbellbacteria bacterium]|nr:transcription antitermination factor NusB [Candidatus Campbellbacteria bacterium]
MANRHLSRSIVLQTLFEWDFNNIPEESTSDVLEFNAKEFAPELNDFSFMAELLHGVLDKQDKLDVIITEAAPDWPLEKISIVDRNILRIGLYELLFANREEVPPKVAINEAIELAKSFGGESSGRFINGVLGAVYKEMGEPGKDEKSVKKEKSKFNRTYEEMPVKRLCGAVVYSENNSSYYLALVHDVFGHWTLTKGHVKDGETDSLGAKRVIKEELGLEADITEELGKNEYVASDPELGKIRKQVTYFLAKAPYDELKLDTDGGLDDCKWYELNDILDLNFYNDILPIVTKAIKTLVSEDKVN